MNCLKEEFFTKLNAKLTAEKETMKEAKPKIQRVPAVLRIRKEKFSDLDLEKFYEPRWISVGPIHHGKPKYQFAEKYKLDLAAKFIGDGGYKSWKEFYEKINEEKLKRILDECFSEEINYEYENCGEDLCKIVVLDGCAILQFIQSYCRGGSEHFKELKMKNDLIAFTKHDLLLLENQVPFRVLSLLIEARSKDSENLKDSINRYISSNIMTPVKYQRVFHTQSVNPEPAHLLDLLLSALLEKPAQRKRPVITTFLTRRGIDEPENMPTRTISDLEEQGSSTKRNNIQLSASGVKPKQKSEQGSENPNEGGFIMTLCSKFMRKPACKEQQSFRSVMDLKSAGIKFKRSETSSLRDIDFSSLGFGGTLKLPPLLVDDSTGSRFMNLIAYEMCPDNTETKYEVTSYIGFLDSLIDYPADVKELRSARILHNLLGCDEDVAQLFNKIATDLVYTKLPENIEEKIERHYRSTWKTWMSQVYCAHFSSPWTIVAFVAALFAIGMSAAQTYYAVFPRDNPCDGVCTRLKKLL